MDKINYQIKLDKILSDITLKGDTPRLLMHSCCAPCSSYCLSYLAEYFKITIYYYNPNISPKEEYDKRVEEQKRLISELPVKNPIEFVAGTYDPERFYEMAKGKEHIPEGGQRCFECYEMRQREAAKYAAEHGFDYFTTTLSVSPHKNSQKLNEIGLRLEQEYGVKYLVSDFKKKGGYQKSIQLSHEYNLYRQNYCGCVYSKIASDTEREIWDVYDENGNLTGRTMKRGIPAEGDFMLCVHIYLYNEKGEFLIQKRSKYKASHPGEWDVTGGAVLAGEKSLDGAIRETKEEVGLDIKNCDTYYAGRTKKKCRLADIYFVKTDAKIDECVVQKEEVDEVKYVSTNKMLDIMKNIRKRDDIYMNIIENAIDKLNIIK